MFLWKYVEFQIYIVIMCSIVLRKQVAGPDNLPEKKNVPGPLLSAGNTKGGTGKERTPDDSTNIVN